MIAARMVAFVIVCSLSGAAGAKDKPPVRRDEPTKSSGCEIHGEGFVKAPGSDTCVKISGRVRVEGAAIFGR